MQWETVIGLEIHTQLATRSKIFSGASTAYGADPNTQACIIDLGFPGVLPVLNETAVDMALKFGVAVNAEIAPPLHICPQELLLPRPFPKAIRSASSNCRSWARARSA